MLDQYFYFQSIRNTTVAVGDLFNNIHVHELDNDGNIEHDIKVPIALARRQKYLTRLREEHAKIEDGVAHTATQITLPRLSYDFTDLTFDPARKLNNTDSCVNVVTENNVTQYLEQRNGLPYNIEYSLTAWTRTMNEMLQIAEQILAFFSPDFVLKVVQVPEMDITRDIPLELGGVSMDDLFDGNLQDDFNIYQWTFTFTAKMYIYPPVQANASVIKRVIANIRKNDEYIYERITIEVDPFSAEKEDIWTVQKTIEDDIAG